MNQAYPLRDHLLDAVNYSQPMRRTTERNKNIGTLHLQPAKYLHHGSWNLQQECDECFLGMRNVQSILSYTGKSFGWRKMRHISRACHFAHIVPRLTSCELWSVVVADNAVYVADRDHRVTPSGPYDTCSLQHLTYPSLSRRGGHTGPWSSTVLSRRAAECGSTSSSCQK